MSAETDSEGTPLDDLNPLVNIAEGKSDQLTGLDDSGTFLYQSGSSTVRRSYSRWSPIEEGVTLAWRDLSVYSISKSTKNKFKRIISGGAVRAGSLVALMGSSGAGKSTLMSALAYRQTGGMIVEGSILINGKPVDDYMRFLAGYMHQEDLFVGSLTVWEHMNIMARLKLDRRTTSKQRRQKVYNLLKHLGLYKCMHTRIGYNGEDKILSGGEKKRVAFATELLTDPPLLFCDEPTTGLDSYSARKLISMMNMMAANGKTIVCTIHQPSSEIFAMFSQVVLLADGKIAFIGSTANALEFFEKVGYRCPLNYNPSDFFIRTLAVTPGLEEESKIAIKRICNEFAVSEYAKEVDVVIQYEFHMGRANQAPNFTVGSKFKDPLWISKLFWVTVRSFLDILRNPTLQWLRIVQKIFIALIVGACYFGSTGASQGGVQAVQGVVFLFVSENTFANMYSVLAMFPGEIPLFIREFKAGLYSPGLFYLSKFISTLPGMIIEPVVFVSVAYFLAGLKTTIYAFMMTILSVTLTISVSTACGIFFSNAFDSVGAAMAYLVPFDYILMVTSGLFINLNAMPDLVSWTKYLSWLMYSTETLSIIQWDGVTNIACDAQQNLPCLTTGDQVLEKYSYSSTHLQRDLWCMFILFLIFHILGFLCLCRKVKKK